MKRKVIALASAAQFLLTLSVIARAQDKAGNVAGSWQLTMQGRNGEVTQPMTIEQKGGTITGSIKAQNGEAALTGTVDGKTITFTTKRQGPNGEITQEFKGTVDGDSIKGTVATGQRSGEFSATRSKS
jgi:hypothetical protein